ncbi:MAG: FUSC family protein [Proteobacteria bacterium]|nr:FUSC family protein [Pseudomonadota bacterium]
MLKSLLEFKPRDVPWMVGLRNTAAVALPLAMGVASGHPGVGLGISAGALNTMFSDQPGPYRLRLRRMLGAAAAAGISAFAGYTLGGNTAVFVPVALLWGIAGGLLVALGPDTGRLGLISMILLVVTSADPRTPAQALGPALLIFAGGVLLMLFAIAAWPLQRYRPERMALAQTCRQLAASARQRDDTAQAPPVTQALTDVEDLLHGHDRARGVAMDTLRVLAELIERIRLELLALGGLRGGSTEDAATLGRLREYAARVLDAIAVALDAGQPALTATAALEGFDAAQDALDQSAGTDNFHLIAVAHARALGGQLRAAVRNTDFAGSRGELRLAAREATLPRALRPRNALATLRANLHLSSVALRHAIRCGVCLAIAIAGERLAGIGHGYWVPMTCAIVLKPDFAGTFRVGLLRVAGTLAGLVLTTALVHVAFGNEWARIALLAILCFGFRQLTTMHYGLGVTLLTGLIVVLLSFEGMAPGDTMAARALGTGLGSALALTAYALWPTWERGRVRGALADLIDAYRQYFLAVSGADTRVRADVRAASRRARTNAQASLDRLRGEPRRRDLVATAEGVFANANRFLRAAMALEAARQSLPPFQDRSAVEAFAGRVEATMLALAHTLREGTPAGDVSLREAQSRLRDALRARASADDPVLVAAWIDASDRIADSIDTLAHLLRRDAARGNG